MGQQAEGALNFQPRKIVRTLAVGQEVDGVIKRVTDFGAFVDIGVGRDGLVHVSEMGQGRVAKPSDVVAEGQQVKVWVKELDREKNRISLSMVAPGTRTLRDLEEGAVVRGKVTRLERYGAFVDIGVGRDGMLHVKEMGRGFVEKPEDVVNVGDEIDVQVVGIDHRRGRVDLSMKELLPPAPEVGTPAEALQLGMNPSGAIEVVEDQFVSPIELAFIEANEASDRRRNERRKKGRSYGYDEDDEEDIIARTIAHHKRSQGM